ncbi:MAG: hypothetical protein G01um10148_382 [Parcubacteria group bacterium Gr01-1014_8]|nr:MAG: hypothetical protein G01um10148_382 [Parcubacteria group bacterium Gr01-1014_8]
MQPLSNMKRRFYLVGLILLFVILLPIVIFFADGYRYRSGSGFVQTGGIYISVPYSNANVYFDRTLYGRSSFLRRSFYIDNLTPGQYVIRVEQPGANTWERTLYVEPQLVTDTSALLVPLEFEMLKIITATSTATTTRTLTRTAFQDMQTVFSKPLATTTASSVAGLSVVLEKGNVYERRNQVNNILPPSNFCIRPSQCVSEIAIENGPDTAISAAYFGGGIIYAIKERGVFFSESDIRFAPVVVSLYPKKGADFRIIDDALIVKDEAAYYEILGL